MDKLDNLKKGVNMLEARKNERVQHAALTYPFAAEVMQLNKLYHGDNREVLPSFPDECVDLIYLDPPFTQRDFGEFNDKWSGGLQEYLDFMIAASVSFTGL